MRSNDQHPSHEDLLMAADGELPESRKKQVIEHLAACWDCRARSGRLDATIEELVRARHAILDPQLPRDEGRRALLKARLSEIAQSSETGRWSRPGHGLALRMALAGGWAVAAILVFVALVALYRSSTRAEILSVAQIPLEPSRSLTPGAIRKVSWRDVCGAARDEGTPRMVSVSLQRRVFQEYGIDDAPAKDYEVDFLITPELGGSDDIRNLWPEPYYSTVWNAHVKDALEERLHTMVCDGQLDLSTAQHDISADWIQAYKKYFRTDRPL